MPGAPIDHGSRDALGAGAHVDGVDNQPHSVNADHRSNSRIQTAQSLAALAGQVTVEVCVLDELGEPLTIQLYCCCRTCPTRHCAPPIDTR